jgi:RimK family alpha-L-glutamate ligase
MTEKIEKFYIYFNGSPRGLRIRRLSDAGKKLGYLVIPVELSELVLTESGIIHNGRPLNVGDNDISWICGNSMVAHEVAKLYKHQNKTIWPDARSIPYSDKYWTATFFSRIGIPTPKTAYLSIDSPDKAIKYVGGFPCVIKRIHSSEGKHVELVNSLDEIKEFIRRGYEGASKGKRKIVRMSFILQEFIKEAMGEDYRVTFVDGEIIATFKRTAVSGFKANLSLGGTGEFLKPIPELEKYTKKIIRKSGLFFGGIDFIKSKKGFLAIEINTSAQFEKFEEYLGRDIAVEIVAALSKLK